MGSPEAPLTDAAVVIIVWENNPEQDWRPLLERGTATSRSREALICDIASQGGDPLLRRTAALGLETLPPRYRVEPLAPLLADPLRAVRIEAARLLAGARLPEPQRANFERALGEYIEAQAENAERPQAQLALGDLHAARGDAASAEAAYREALALDAGFVPAYVNLAELLRNTGREHDALQLLRTGMRAAPRQAALHEALALALVRQGDKPAALKLLQQAIRLDSASARTFYLQVLALYDGGRKPEGLAALEAALRKFPGNRELLLAQAAYRRQAGDADAARKALARLAAINPHDPALTQGRKEN